MPNNYKRPSYYEKVSELGKPILEILCSEIKDNCFDTIHSEENAGRLRFDGLNAVKYLWRLGQKGTKTDTRKDLLKAIDYLESEALLRYQISRSDLGNRDTATGGDEMSLRLGKAWKACCELMDALPIPTEYDILFERLFFVTGEN